MGYKLNGKNIASGEITNRLKARKSQKAAAKKRAKRDQWQGSIAQDLVDSMDEDKPISSKSFRGGWPSPPKKLNNMDHSDA